MFYALNIETPVEYKLEDPKIYQINRLTINTVRLTNSDPTTHILYSSNQQSSANSQNDRRRESVLDSTAL